jgi:hypothetical protein
MKRVRLGMPVADAEVLAGELLAAPADVAARLHDQLWLATVFIEQRRRTNRSERDTFDRRANRVLELLDHPNDERPA